MFVCNMERFKEANELANLLIVTRAAVTMCFVQLMLTHTASVHA